MEKTLTGGRTRMSGKILKMVQLSILTAILIVMSLTPLGYLRVGTISITFLMVPVVVGAIVCGPAGGAFLGFVFGLTSFLQCVTGSDPFGALTWAVNPIGAFLVCIPTRVLAGFLPGLLVKALKDRINLITFPLAALFGSLLNTFLSLGTLLLVFSNSPQIAEALGGTVFGFVLATILGVNGVIEAVACTLIGAGLSAALIKVVPKAKEE
jgi:uncharacterized membrane protein